MATRDVFSAEEQAQLRGFPDIDRAELIRYFTLTGADEAFVRRFRTSRNVLAVAVQLCTVPWLGFVPDDVPSAPAAAVGRLSQRLGVPMGELRGCGDREQTRTDHLREVLAYAGWRTIDAAGWKDLDEFLPAPRRRQRRGIGSPHRREVRQGVRRAPAELAMPADTVVRCDVMSSARPVIRLPRS